MNNFRPLGDVKVKRFGRQLLINVPRDVAEHLGLRPGGMAIVYRADNRLVLAPGQGPAKIIDVGGGKLRIYIGGEEAPFREGDRVLVTADDKGRLLIERIDYYIAKPSIRPGQYKLNIPWELIEKENLVQYSYVKIYTNNGKIIIEPIRDPP